MSNRRSILGRAGLDFYDKGLGHIKAETTRAEMCIILLLSITE
jgi:hypothetical protein